MTVFVLIIMIGIVIDFIQFTITIILTVKLSFLVVKYPAWDKNLDSDCVISLFGAPS